MSRFNVRGNAPGTQQQQQQQQYNGHEQRAQQESSSFGEATSFVKDLWNSPEVRRATMGKAKEAAGVQSTRLKAWWDKNWEEANRMEPTQVTRAREERRRRMREDGLYGAKDVKDLPADDVRRYGMRVGEAGGYVQPGYNRIDGNTRMTTSMDHSQEAMEDRWDAMFHGAGRPDGGWVDPATAEAETRKAKEEYKQRERGWHYEQKAGPQAAGFSFSNPTQGQSPFSSSSSNKGPKK